MMLSPRSWPTWLTLTAAVLLAHVGVVASFAADDVPVPAAPQAVRVRTVTVASASTLATETAPADPATAPVTATTTAPAMAPVPPKPRARVPAVASGASGQHVGERRPVAGEITAGKGNNLHAVAATSAGDAPPVYKTVMPPPVTLNYDMRRGGLIGTGDLQWRPTATGYEAQLHGRVAGFSILTWASQGGFDDAGIAPQRYTDQRRGKAVQAANFQRQAGKITFSGPSTEYPLVAGAQDRLSWMIQMAAIAAGDPDHLSKPGNRISMLVAGARGDADVWSFQVVGLEDITAGDASIRTIKLIREPRKPYDTRVEVWLDPAQHHLPIRARLTSDGDTLELLQHTAQPAT